MSLGFTDSALPRDFPTPEETGAACSRSFCVAGKLQRFSSFGHGNQWEVSPKQELGAHMWRSELWYSKQEKTCNASTGNINTKLIKLLLNSSARQIWADLLFKGKIFNYLLILTSTGDPRSIIRPQGYYSEASELLSFPVCEVYTCRFFYLNFYGSNLGSKFVLQRTYVYLFLDPCVEHKHNLRKEFGPYEGIVRF